MTCFEKSKKFVKAQYKTIKSDEEKTIEIAVQMGFPICRGTYPDCPEKPAKEHSACRTCPVLDEILENE